MEFIQGLLILNIFDLTIKEKTLQVKGTIILNSPFLYELVINSRKSKSFAKIGLFLDKVLYPSHVPKFFKVFLPLSSIYKYSNANNSCIYLIVSFNIYLDKIGLFI